MELFTVASNSASKRRISLYAALEKKPKGANLQIFPFADSMERNHNNNINMIKKHTPQIYFVETGHEQVKHS